MLSSPRENREFDIVIFGASGFTGQYVVERMARTNQIENIKWAVAGRTQVKVEETLKTATKCTGIDVMNITIIIADVADEQSIVDMCRRTKILLNCVGPFIFHGEIVVKTCIETKTDQLDIAGEAFYNGEMQLKYNEEAKKSEVYVISSCGISSLAIEAGLQFLKANFDGDVDSVDICAEMKYCQQFDTMHYGTFESWIYNAKMSSKSREQNKILFQKGLPKYIQPTKRKYIHFNKEIGKWCSKLVFMDNTTKSSEYFNYHHRNLRPAKTNMYMVNENIIESFLAVITFSFVFLIMSLFSGTRRFLRKHHRILTLGIVSKRGPPREVLEKATLKLFCIGRGHSKKLLNPEELHTTSPDKKMLVTVEGGDAGYCVSSATLIQAAMCVLKEREKLPNKGGVIPPGAALLHTSIIKRLSNNGLTFKVFNDL